MKPLKPITFRLAFVLFAGAGIVFYIIIRVLVPYLSAAILIHPLILWSVLGCLLLFLPLFLLALFLTAKEGHKLTLKIIKTRLRLNALTKRDLLWTAIGILFSLAVTGAVMIAWNNLADTIGMQKLDEITPFIKFDPLQGYELLILLAWLPMFFFNIVGEEFLWRGVILPRQEAAYGKSAWIINAMLHLLVHICFGFPLILTIIPLVLVIPFIVAKTRNTYTGMIIHAAINGPAFILIALGVFTW
jgi:membrane protease YdiL (CAAX protease family)